MGHPQLTSEQRETIGRYVESRRKTLNLTIKQAATAATLSERKWAQVEGGYSNHSERTLRLVAQGLGEPPGHILELAGVSYFEEFGPPGNIEDLRRRVGDVESVVDRLDEQMRELMELPEQVRELITTVRSVHHASPDT